MLAFTKKWSMKGANMFMNKIANIIPSGYAGLITRTKTTMRPMRKP